MSIFKREKANDGDSLDHDPDKGYGGARGSDVVVAVNQITAVAQQLGITLEDNRDFSAHVFDNAKKMTEINRLQDRELQNIIAETELLFGRLSHVGAISGEMKDTGVLSRKVLGESISETRSVVSSVRDIESAANINLNLMEDLRGISVTISDVLESVSEISDQTKLLALNATIESARAGSAGAGFGIVAQHIQRLSDATQGAVDDIHKLVEKLRSSIEGMSAAMRTNAEKVREVSEQSSRVGDNLSSVERSFDALIGKSNEVGEEISGELKQAVSVREKLSSLQSDSSENIKQIEEVYRGLEKHHSLMDEMNDLGARLNRSSMSLQNLFTDKLELDESSLSRVRILGRDALENLRKGLPRNGCETLESGKCKILCDGILSRFGDFEAVWVNDIKGRFVYSNPPAGIANARVREWFRSSVTGSDFVSEPYVSAITGKPCLTVVIPVLGSGGTVIGVLGCDLHM
jgi:methyl-accepting chemotaxis protein